MGIPSPGGGTRQQAGGRRQGRVIPFGKYLLLERIAVGGMAEVYMAKSFGIEGFEKILAIKRILPTMAEDEDFIEMFIDEAKIAGQLNHANIAPIFELGKIGDSHYIAMEYVWGKDLLQIMNRFRRLRKKAPPPMVAWTASKMCEALDYAHHKRDRRGTPLNIIHRDVSPQNVLISYEGEVKLIDFGIAKAASRTTKTQAGVLKGKFGYMSPEQVRGLPIDLRSDIFAVGTCMYEMLTSERLFMGESDFSTLEKVRNAEVVPVSQVVREVPPELERIVMRALSREPADRFQSAGELQEGLQRYLASVRPPFGTSKLAAWLKTAFATEMSREKARLDSFAHVGRPSVLGGGARRRAPGPSGGGHVAPPVPTGPGPTRRPPPMSKPAMPAASHVDPMDVQDLPDDDLEAEKTMVSESPFQEWDEAQAQQAQQEQQEIGEEATQIFFSADEAEDAPTANHQFMPPGGPPAAGAGGVVSASFRPGQHKAASTSRAPGRPSPMPPGRRPPPVSRGVMSPPAALGGIPPAAAPLGGVPPAAGPLGGIPAAAAPLGGIPPAVGPVASSPHVPAVGSSPGVDRVDSSAFGSPPASGAPSIKPEATPVGLAPQGRQRNLATVEVEGGVAPQPVAQSAPPPAQQQQSSSGRMALLFAIAALVMLAVGVGGAWLVFGGEEFGTIEVHTVPAEGAVVRIDGVPRGRAPIRVERIPAGQRLIEIEADGFRTSTRQVNVIAGSAAMLEIALEPVGGEPSEPVATAETSESAMEEGAEEPEGESEGTSARDREREQERAEARREREAEDAEQREREARQERLAAAAAEATAMRAATAMATMQTSMARTEGSMSSQMRPVATTMMDTAMVASGRGHVLVNAIPFAYISIDGRDTGRFTPQRIPLSAGSHRIGLRTNDGRTHSGTVDVPAGETVRFSHRF